MSKIAFMLFFLLAGCAGSVRERTVYQDVYIPQKCTVDAPVRPAKAGNAVLQLIDFIHYTHELELAVRACRGE